MLGGLWRWFNPTKVEAVAELMVMLESEAMHIAQKVPLDYVNARTGIFSAQLFTEKMFLDAMADCRRTSYVALIGDLVIMTEGVLRRPDDPRVSDALGELFPRLVGRAEALALDGEAKGRAIEHFRGRFAIARQHAPRTPADLAVHSGQAMFDSLPLHRYYTKDDNDAIVATVQLRMTNFLDQLRKRIARETIVGNLLAGP